MTRTEAQAQLLQAQGSAQVQESKTTLYLVVAGALVFIALIWAFATKK